MAGTDGEGTVVSSVTKLWKETLDRFSKDPTEDITIFTSIPERCRKEPCYIGIDEAGRGPVLGPMVYSIFAAVVDPTKAKTDNDEGEGKKKKGGDDGATCPPLLIDAIKKLNDSKQVNEKAREEIFQQFADLDHIAFGIKIIAPGQISSKSFKRQKVSLNDVSHNAAMELIQGFVEGDVKIKKVFVDTVGPMDKYQKKLELKFPELSFKVDKKADSKYKPVSAASICAKVTRDEVLKTWVFKESDKVTIPEDGWGSGYPGDDVTKRFLRKNIDPVFGFPNIVRDSWSTAANLLETRAVKIKWEVEEDEEGAVPPKITKFFAKSAVSKEQVVTDMPIALKKAQFFSYRNLCQTENLF